MFELFKKEDEDPKDLNDAIHQFKILKKDLRKLSKELESIKKNLKITVQKVGVVRFNPFKSVGGNQSFSIAFLDGNNDGVVITSLYTRDGNRTFGKPIAKGISKHALTNEEKQAIEQARKVKIKEA